MVDYQFLGLVAVALALVTRGSLLPILALTALVALVMFGYEALVRRYGRRQPHVAAGPPASPSDSEITCWMSVMDRVLRTND